MAVGAVSVPRQEVPRRCPSWQPQPHRSVTGSRGASASSQRGAAAPGAWQGLGGGSQPPSAPPCPALSGAPEQNCSTWLPSGEPTQANKPGSLNLPGKSPLGRRAGEREGAAAGLRRPGKEAGAITTLSFFRLILTSHFNLIEPCLASRFLARRVRGLGPDAAGW